MDIHEDINAILDKVYDALNRHDAEGVAMLAAEDVTVEDIPAGTVSKGRDAAVEHYRRGFRAFPDVQYRTINRIRQGDTIVDEWVLRGTHTGELTVGKMVIKPTNKAFELRGASIIQFRGGHVRHQRLYYDLQSMQKQLGLSSILKMHEAGNKG